MLCQHPHRFSTVCRHAGKSRDFRTQSILRHRHYYIMKQTTNILIALVATAHLSDAALILHSTLDNADVGAGAGTDTTQAGAFSVADSISANNGTAENVIDGGATGTNHVTSGATGQHGEALSFDRAGVSNNRAVQYGDIHDIGTGDYTVTMWFNTAATNSLQFLGSKGNAGSTAVGWSIFIENDSLIARLGGGGSGNRASQSVDITGQADSWHHVAFVIDNTAGTVTGYLNGSTTGWTNGGGGPSGNTFTAGTDISDASQLRLGISGIGTGEFRGELDDFRIYNEALDATGVSASMVAIPEPSSTALVGLGGLALILRRRK